MRKYTFLYVVIFLLSTTFFSCSSSASDSASDKDTTIVANEVNTSTATGEQSDSSAVSDKAETLGIEYTAKYICPNHCKGSGSDKAAECSNSDCGMELMENPNYKEK